MTIVLAVCLVVAGALVNLLIAFAIAGRIQRPQLERLGPGGKVRTLLTNLRHAQRRRRRPRLRTFRAASEPAASGSDVQPSEPATSGQPAQLTAPPASQRMIEASKTIEAALLAEDVLTQVDQLGDRGHHAAPEHAASEPAAPEIDVGIHLIQNQQPARVAYDGEPIIIGSSPEARIRIPGEPEQAAIVFSDGIALVARLTEGPLRLGDVEVGPVGVPITSRSSRLELQTAILDLSAFVPAMPTLPLLMYWATGGTPAGAAMMGGCAAIVLGTSGQRIAEQAVNCFAGVGRRSAVWALEAGNACARSRAIGCLVGLAQADRGFRILVAAQCGELEVMCEPQDHPVQVTRERPELLCAEIAFEPLDRGATGQQVLNAVTIRLLGTGGQPVLKGVMQLQLTIEEFARRHGGPAKVISQP